ncbi:hypothetical protein HME9304_02855 [Flagellimonas maritima]|uniref:Lipoprotein n=2 Tax=Flagellimonas maritima TaxID=1383885 RepID=A0A2Z4LV81_9FLAO|nr:hypothetical protein HME9304_02855 [Allomuricauda aurantiaca]
MTNFKQIAMKKSIAILVLGLCMACNTATKKESAATESQATTTKTKKEGAKPMKSGDYSTLLINYSCDMDIPELAKVLQVLEADLSLSEYQTPGKCTFNLNGFGKNRLGGGTRLYWGPFPSSKGQNRKEIANYLKYKKEGTQFMGMDIALAETGDCYLAYQPAQGRMIIYNENYDQAFLINYDKKNANTDRTEEQHEALRLKMTDLANYLLKKHRK